MRIDPVHVHLGSLTSAYKPAAAPAEPGPSAAAPSSGQEAVSVALSTNLHGWIEQAVRLHETMMLRHPVAEARDMVQSGAGLTEEQLDALTAALLQDLV